MLLAYLAVAALGVAVVVLNPQLPRLRNGQPR
jgi:hypothetical protein